MSGPGIIKTYSGTPSWSDIKQPFERFQNDPYSDLFCTNCYHTQ